MLQWKAWTLTEELRTPTWGFRLEDSDLRNFRIKQAWMLQWKAWTLTVDLRTSTWGLRLEDSNLRTLTWGLRLRPVFVPGPSFSISSEMRRGREYAKRWFWIMQGMKPLQNKTALKKVISWQGSIENWEILTIFLIVLSNICIAHSK